MDSSKDKIVNRLSRLIEASQSLAEVEQLEILLPQLLQLARDVTFAEAASFLLYNPKREILELACVRDEILGDRAQDLLEGALELKMGEGIAGWVAVNKKAIIVEDVQSDPRFHGDVDKQTGFVTRNLLVVPVLYGQELLGVVSLVNSKTKSCFDKIDLKLIESFANLAAVALVRSRLLETRLEQSRLRIQLEAASKIQELFRPVLPDLGEGSRVWALSQPAAFVGGDLYDMIALPDGSWLLYLADVAGKGFPAALIMVAVWVRLRSVVLRETDMEKILFTLNNTMCDLFAEEGHFVSMLLGKYWTEEGIIELLCAGHLPPLHISSGKVLAVPRPESMVLGVVRDFKYKKSIVTLHPGESILFISDGVTEAQDGKNELFGSKRLIECIQKRKDPPWGQEVHAAVKAWQGAAEAADDLTLLEIWRDGEVALVQD